jgi:hypothetical protein
MAKEFSCKLQVGLRHETQQKSLSLSNYARTNEFVHATRPSLSFQIRALSSSGLSGLGKSGDTANFEAMSGTRIYRFSAKVPQLHSFDPFSLQPPTYNPQPIRQLHSKL